MKQFKQFKVSGTTFEGRQGLLAHLGKTGLKKVTICRDNGNQYDQNAIKVIAHDYNGLKMPVGFVPKAIAAELAPMMDAGKFVKVEKARVTGGRGLRYGMTVDVSYDVPLTAADVEPAYEQMTMFAEPVIA